MDSNLLNIIKAAIRVKADSANTEIAGLISSCKKELELSGVYITDENDALAKQVIILYCKAHYGYDEKAEQFQKSYEALRDSMSLSGDYKKNEEEDGSKTDMEYL